MPAASLSSASPAVARGGTAKRQPAYAERMARAQSPDRGFRGNKAALPRKICATCGREMVWRRRWATVWDDVTYRSERCRRERRSGARPDADAHA